MQTARIHSIETCGTVDGPGIRFVLFLQGCPLRCQYCHNPDTWNPSAGRLVTVDEIMEEMRSYRSYMRFSGGGVTVSGGEPLLQPEFVTELFRRCREEGIHTVLDTSGHAPISLATPVFKLTDLVLLDVKAFYPQTFQNLTGVDIAPTLQALNYLNKANIPTWIRYVQVPGLTDNEEEIRALAQYLSTLCNIQKVEVIAFHKMGEYKWAELGLENRLKNTPPAHQRDIEHTRKIFEEYGLATDK